MTIGENLSHLVENSTEQALAFGPFRLIRSQKLLLENNKPVRIGSRAFSLLVALVERAGEVVSREELVAYVWPATVVEETSLRVHIAALRKVLGEGHAGARFITNVPGRGYCFVADVTRPIEPAIQPQSIAAETQTHNLPARITRMIGRADVVTALASLVPGRRLVTIVGPGGMGKTTVALAIADELLERYADGVCFVDLAPLTDPLLVPGTLASVLGIKISSENALPAFNAFLKDRQTLIVLDNCEHLIEAAARLAEGLLQGAAGIHILATSREPLNVSGEWVHRLAPLEAPPEFAEITADQAMNFSAVQLFAERAMGATDSFELSESNAGAVGGLCRRLDGIPLAIELAAARVDALGVFGLATRLDEYLTQLTRGRRTALPRHQTLRALLDWSFQLLSETEQTVLCRLAIFKSGFTLESAVEVASDDLIRDRDVIESVMNLTTKSLLSAEARNDVIRYRLMMTTRSYAFEELTLRGQLAVIARRHAICMQHLLEKAESEWDTVSRAQCIDTYSFSIDDVRAALDWSFSEAGDLSLGMLLTAAAHVPMYVLGLSVSEEYDRALGKIHLLSPPQPLVELRLNAALCFSLAQTPWQGHSHVSVIARTLELAEKLDKPKYKTLAHYSLWSLAFGNGDYPEAAIRAASISTLSRSASDPLGILLADRLTAQTHHYMGNHATARIFADRVLHHPAKRMPPEYLTPVPTAVSMRMLLARTLWFEGYADQAARMAQESVELALADHTPFVMSQAVGLALCPIAFWRGDNELARAWVDKLMQHSLRYSYGYWQSWALSYQAVLAVRDSETAMAGLADPVALVSHATNPKELDCMGTLAECLLSEATIARVEAGTVGWCAPEILRAHGVNLLKSGKADAAAAAEEKYLQSLDLARKQGAKAWELRAATSLGALWQSQGRTKEAHDLVLATYALFTEGFDTADLRAARALLDQLEP